MNTRLSIMILEDNSADFELVQRQLHKAGFDFTSQWARDKASFLEALDQEAYDLLLVDYALPGFDGLTAMAFARRRFADLPVVLVSGAIGEETAIDALKAGATDYVLKQRLERLGPVTRRALREAEQLKEKRLAQQGLREAMEFLEEKVRQRTAELAHMVDTLQEEVRRRELAEDALKLANEQLSTRATQLRALSGEMILAEQRERKRLAKLLHDGLLQDLAAAKIRLEGIAIQLADDRLGEELDEVTGILAASIRMSQSLSAELSPPLLYQSSLCNSLAWLARSMLTKHRLNVNLLIEKKIDLPEDMKILLFESVRELLFNTVKHAQVSCAKVTQCDFGQTGIRITICDDGVGFDPCRLQPPGDDGSGFGLLSIRERLNLIGGRLEIDSAPGKGSRMSLIVPDIQPPRPNLVSASTP